MPRLFKLGLILMCALSGVLAASAQTGLPATLTGGPGGTTVWDIVPDGGTSTGRPHPDGICSSALNPGIMVDDARLGSQLDAYDQSGIWINNRVFTSTTVTVGASTLLAGPMVTSNGLNVTLNYVALNDRPILRTLVSIQNQTGATQPVTVTMATNFGSDQSTQYIATSSGDATFAGNDRWAVSADGATTVTDVVNTTALFGLGSPAAIPSFADDQVFACPGAGNAQEGILAEFTLSVPANATQRLMFFQEINATINTALAGVGSFDAPMRLSNPLAAGLTLQQLAEILNWRDFYPIYLPLIRK